VRRLVAEGALKLSASGRVSTPELTPERIEELAALRALLEPELASRALPRAHAALIDRMAAINAVIDETIARGDASGYVRTNLEFHRTLYLRAQAPAMLAMLETVWLQLGPTMRSLYERLGRRQASELHRKIIAALRAGDEPGLRLRQRRLPHRLRIGRMRVAGHREILGRRAEFHRDADLVDQVARPRPDDVRAEDAVGRGIGEDLDEAFVARLAFARPLPMNGKRPTR
jgi:hypothetical protein